MPEPEIVETESPPDLIEIDENDGILINTRFSSDRRLRRTVYNKILAAKKRLPEGYKFVIYEAYRPRARQLQLWDALWTEMAAKYPEKNDEELTVICTNFVANPHGVGSGHQFGSAIDISIINKRGELLDMGADIQEFSEKTATKSSLVTETQKQNRRLLCAALEEEGMINYPSEWWHFSYGDRKWAQIQGHAKTLYGLLSF